MKVSIIVAANFTYFKVQIVADFWYGLLYHKVYNKSTRNHKFVGKSATTCKKVHKKSKVDTSNSQPVERLLSSKSSTNRSDGI